MKLCAALAFGLNLSLCSTVAQFVEVTTELEIAGYFRKGMERTLRVSSHNHSARVVFGTNTWLIEEPEPESTSGNLWVFAHSKIVNYSTAVWTNAQAGRALDRVHTEISQDGNPGRSVRTSDILSYTAFINWYAFCSAPALNQRQRALFLPSDLWKRYVNARGFVDEVVRFDDSLGLPRSIDLYTTNQQPVFQYRIAASTNFAGWTIPLEFHVVQYDQVGTNAWQVQFTGKGRVTNIRMTSEPALTVREQQ